MKYFNLIVGIGCGIAAGYAFGNEDYGWSCVLLFCSIVNNAIYFSRNGT